MKSAFWAVGACLWVGALHADIIIMPGHHPLSVDHNILGTNKVSGFTVPGHFNAFPQFTVNFSSSELLVEHGSGNAEITGCGVEPCSSSAEHPINDLRIDVSSVNNPIILYDRFLFNMDISGNCAATPAPAGCANTVPTITVRAVKDIGGGLLAPEPDTIFTFPPAVLPNGQFLTKGSNDFTLTTSGGEHIISTTITTAPGRFTDLRGFSMGVLAPAGLIVPEPSTFAPLMGLALGAIGLLGRSRRKKV